MGQVCRRVSWRRESGASKEEAAEGLSKDGKTVSKLFPVEHGDRLCLGPVPSMSWDASANAGFSSGKPWLPINSDYEKVNC